MLPQPTDQRRVESTVPPSRVVRTSGNTEGSGPVLPVDGVNVRTVSEQQFRAGLPPFRGFVAKFFSFRNVVVAGDATYATIGLMAVIWTSISICALSC